MNKRGQSFGLMNFFVLGMILIIGFSVVGPVDQELKNVNCFDNSTSFLLQLNPNISYSEPEGYTNSFGGAGSNRFGGYNNKVTHDPFLNTIAKTSMIKTNESLMNPNCVPLDSITLFFLDNFTIIFISITVIFVLLVNPMFRSYPDP